jgi:hypothetical protein
MSGAAGATAFRVHWVDGGGTAVVDYEAIGLPDQANFKVGAYGMGFGFTPMFVDPFLASGGLQLDSSDFVDVDMSTIGIGQITNATLAIYGRSLSVSESGSFNWQTFTNIGSTLDDYVSNVPPYQWYPADATASFNPGDGGIVLRIKAGPSSDSLVVSRIELCMVAN